MSIAALDVRADKTGNIIFISDSYKKFCIIRHFAIVLALVLIPEDPMNKNYISGLTF